jgi:hypothetical protein
VLSKCSSILRKAVEFAPLDLMTNFRLVQANCYARRYDEAVRAGRTAIELISDSPYTYFYVALSLVARGSKGESWEMASVGIKLADGLPLGEGFIDFIWRPRRDLNPCYRRERAMS